MKPCQYCGAELPRLTPFHNARRKYCNRECMKRGFTGRQLVPVMSKAMAHVRSRRLVPPGPCQDCGDPTATDVHHRDGNWSNNDLSNLVRVCRSCHMKDHRSTTHCPKGHEYSDANTYRSPGTGTPRCRQCRSDSMVAAYYRSTGRSDLTGPAADRVTCSYCGRLVVVRKNGLARQHGRDPRCEGSGKPISEIARLTALLDGVS